MALPKSSEHPLTPLEIKAFQNNPLVKNLYKCIEMYDLRKKAFIQIASYLKSKEDTASFEDL